MSRKVAGPARVRGSNKDPFKHNELIKVGTPHMPGPDTVQPGNGKVVVTVDDGGQGKRLVKKAFEAKRPKGPTGNFVTPVGITDRIPNRPRKTR